MIQVDKDRLLASAIFQIFASFALLASLEIGIILQQGRNTSANIWMRLQKLVKQDVKDSGFAKINIAQLFSRTSGKKISSSVYISIEFCVTMLA